jgi:ElaB/YqjD/DUF883 family membrane-anchored ribosome-binding protein
VETSLALILIGGLSASLGTQDPPAPKPPAAEEKELGIDEALQMLHEVARLMETAEELLADSSRGKALQSEKETLEKIDKLLKADPAAQDPSQTQQRILEKIEKLMKKSGQSQDESAKKMGEVIRRVKAQQQGQGQGQGQPQQQKPGPQSQKPDQPQNPATSPYDPNRRGDPINRFRSKGDRTGRWGDLPPRLREAMLTGKRDLDEYPPEFQQFLMEYFKALSGEER